MWTTKKKKYLLCFSVVLLFGIISGLMFYLSIEGNIKDNILFSLTSYEIGPINNIIKHIIILSILLISSLLVVGVPLSLFYLYYEGISIGFVFAIFFAKFGLSGLLYSLIYLIISNLIFILLLSIFVKKIFNISGLVLNHIVYRRQSIIKDKLIINFKNAILILIFIIIYDILLYFFSEKILLIFVFLLK